MAALRFIIEGEGACTVVNGEPESMEPRDLLLTPNWYWHGHFSEHDEPMIWLDGLDVPLVQGLGATFQRTIQARIDASRSARRGMNRSGATALEGSCLSVTELPARIRRCSTFAGRRRKIG